MAPNLPPQWKAEFVMINGPYLTNMLVVIRRLRAIEKQDVNGKEARHSRNGCSKNNKFNNKGQGKGQGQDKGKGQGKGKTKEKGNGEMKNLCQKHDGEHE
eukprot:375515-Ditylum_brightwellii.AAC.1